MFRDDCMTYIGIDPGKDGAIAALNGGCIVKSGFDEMEYREILRQCVPSKTICFIEKVSAMPGQGVTSMFHFGENYGFIQGLLYAYEIPCQTVTPAKWKREFQITKDKNTSIEVCKRLFPKESLLRTGRCKKDHDGIAEALLIAEFARRRFNANE